MTSAEFVQQLKKDIQAFPKIRIKHPFLKAVCAGTATMDQIRAWAIQDYQFRAAVPRIVTAVWTPAVPAIMNSLSDSPSPSD